MRPKVPSFVEIIQPNFSWKTEYRQWMEGRTRLPKKGAARRATLIIPEGCEAPVERLVRMHEILHARFSPDIHDDLAPSKMGTAEFATAQISEDIRIHHLGRKAGVMDDAEMYIPKEIIGVLAKRFTGDKRDEKSGALLYCAAQSYPFEASVGDLKNFANFERHTGTRLRAQTRATLRLWNHQVSAALKLKDPKAQYAALAKATASVIKKLNITKFPTPQGADMMALLRALKPSDMPSKVRVRADRPMEDAEDFSLGDCEYHVIRAESQGWGKMSTVLAPLQRHFRASTKRQGAAAPDGSLPKHWGRWFAEKTIWERKGPRLGGTLLLDISGSMSWATEETKELIETHPAMTIAAYSGRNTSGRLTIIARHGRITGDDKWRIGHGGGNVVDGRALEWLAAQPGPRVWFSDGGVTGHGDGAYEDLQRECARICRLGNIQRTISVEAVKAVLSGKAHPDAFIHRPLR